MEGEAFKMTYALVFVLGSMFGAAVASAIMWQDMRRNIKHWEMRRKYLEQALNKSLKEQHHQN